ncbi:MAG TPA: AAA family ATPase [Kofleriaceae bacterium]|nr:AAA family ATPase [Kofleriaceae bacterium]
MPRLADLAYQDRAVAVVRAAMAAGRLHHALLLTGPPAADKRALALAIAGALDCETAPGEGCTTCATCTRIADGVHPDVITLAREGAAQIIPIETVRTQVVAAVGLPPHEARERVFLIDEATALQPAAANALLKTLEEPPARTRFILMTVAPDQLLPTIRSRCQRVSLQAPTADARKAAAGEEDPVAALALELCAAVSGGPGAAIRLAQHAGEGKIDAAAVIELAAVELHARARAAIEAGDVASARRDAAAANVLLAAHPAVAIHHGHGAVSLEAIAHRLQRELA